MKNTSTVIILLIILCAAALIRGLYFFELLDHPMPTFMAEGVDFDQHNFVELAREIRQKGWLGESFAGFSPSYGYVIAFVFSLLKESIYSVIAVQLALGVLWIFFYYKAAALLFDNKKIGLIAAGMAALYGPAMFYEGAVLRASLITGLNLLGFYVLCLAQKKKNIWINGLGGMVVGVSIALRPHLLPVFVVLYFLLFSPFKWPQRFQWTVVFVVGVLIAITPITLRNAALGQEAVIARPGPTIFWLGNSHDSAGVGLTRTPTQQALAEESGHSPMKTLMILLREIKAHPSEYAGLYWRKFKMIFNDYEIPGNMNFYIFKDNSRALQMTFLEFGCVSTFGLFGGLLLARRFKEFSLLYLYLFGLVFFVFMFHVQSRYRMPVVPFFILFAAYGVHYIGQQIKTRSYQTLCLSFLVLGGLAWFTRVDARIVEEYLHGRIGYVSYSNWSFAYGQKFKAQVAQTGVPDIESLKKALMFRNQSIAAAGGKNKDTLILNRAYLYFDAHRYEEALADLTYLVQKYPGSEQVVTTKNDLEYFLQNIPKERRHAPLL